MSRPAPRSGNGGAHTRPTVRRTTPIERLEEATRLERVFVTHDESLRQIHRLYQEIGRTHGGILLVPKPRGLSQEEELAVVTARILLMADWVASFEDPRGKLFEWHDLRAKLERGFRLSRFRDEYIRRALDTP